MEYSPPPLFKQGPSALARLIFFVALALALLVSDARFRTLEMVRAVLDIGLYPLQRAALVPRDMIVDATSFVVSTATLRRDNAKLSSDNLRLSVQANRTASLAAENAHLRALLALREQTGVQTTPAEIQYDMRDPFTQKVVIGRGSQQSVEEGSPVVTEDGMIGQVTRVFPMQSEVTLLTDKDQAVPVQIVRTGLRGVVYGTPAGNALELRFVPISADIVVGDELVTSGLDGIYPPGLPVAKVVRVDKLADTAFARVVCVPVAAVRGARDVLVVSYKSGIPPRPEPLPAPAAQKDAKGKKAAKTADKNDKAAQGGKTDKAASQTVGKPVDKAASDLQASSATGKAAGQALKPTDKPAAGTKNPQAPAAGHAASGAAR
ncbi:rod shape-determining protein MreC [Trinickia symbiotica]|uniref:Cell shape-determining protein MreC n=1 Tax=Trinickia symbiotica TaxID=863227 RepID=A0A2T3XYD0_9BURK|nr:rod shape-determining protein MreC [Trinickia symbiotica]PTB21519.1 rod shape-determining protein MreC [Trinickia symbiotica]